MSAFYNDNDRFCCDWLQNLMDRGLIAPGTIDDRSIEDIQASDLAGFTQVHLFAGIAGWPLALDIAGWSRDRPVWTASCPCPPFSAAGKATLCPSCESRNLVWSPSDTGCAICTECGCDWYADERHLWPEVWRLIAECRPARVYGEQVAGPSGMDWLSGLEGSLEILRYAVAAADLPAAGVGSPHRRQRLFWVADADSGERERRTGGQGCRRHRETTGREEGDGLLEPRGAIDDLGDAASFRREHVEIHRGWVQTGDGTPEHVFEFGSPSEVRGLGDANGQGSQGHGYVHPDEGSPGPAGASVNVVDTDRDRLEAGSQAAQTARQGGASDADGVADLGWPAWHYGLPGWEHIGWVACADGVQRPVEPGVLPLASGVPSRVGRLRAYGNAIVPQVAAVFIQASD